MSEKIIVVGGAGAKKSHGMGKIHVNNFVNLGYGVGSMAWML